MFPAPELLGALALPAPTARDCPLLSSNWLFVSALAMGFCVPPESLGAPFSAAAAAQVIRMSIIEQRRAMPTNELGQITEGIVLASLL